jgi:nicotinamide-nucleotide amidase
MFTQEDLSLAQLLGTLLVAQQHRLVTAESCTAGLVAGLITEIAGSSAWFERGYVSYSNQSKQDMLGVNPQTIADFGAVSADVAAAMLAGVIKNSPADCALAITGIAGPGGGTVEKPVGLVCFAWQFPNQVPRIKQQVFSGSRHQIRMKAVRFALQQIVNHYNNSE